MLANLRLSPSDGLRPYALRERRKFASMRGVGVTFDAKTGKNKRNAPLKGSKHRKVAILAELCMSGASSHDRRAAAAPGDSNRSSS